jgi:hypothetical protein
VVFATEGSGPGGTCNFLKRECSDYFFEMGQPSVYIEKMHTIFFYFIYSIKTGKKPYNNHTNRSSHQTQVSKNHQTSTTLEETTRPYASAIAGVDSQKNPTKAPCVQAPDVISTSLSVNPPPGVRP